MAISLSEIVTCPHFSFAVVRFRELAKMARIFTKHKQLLLTKNMPTYGYYVFTYFLH